jgi:hypothetical protein
MAPSLASYREARTNFLAYLLVGLGSAVIVYCLPKAAAGPTVRLGYTVILFGGLIVALSAFTGPLGAFLRLKVEVGWRDAGDEIRSLQLALATRIERFVERLAWILLIAVTSLFLCVLAKWDFAKSLLGGASPYLSWVFWVTLAAVPVELFLSTHRIAEIITIKRAIRRQLEVSGWQGEGEEEVEAQEQALQGPPVVVSAPLGFKAGGMEWSWSDFQRSAIVFGATGSGKTATVLNAFLDGLLSSTGHDRSVAAAALILDPKGDYRQKVGVLMTRLGRRDDLRILDPSQPKASVRWNPFDSPDDALEIAGRFAAVLALMGMKSTQDTFFIDSAKTFLRHAIGLLRAVEPAGTPPSFARVLVLVSQQRRVIAESLVFLLRCACQELGRAVTKEGFDALRTHSSAYAQLIADLDTKGGNCAVIASYLHRWASENDEEHRGFWGTMGDDFDRAAGLGPAIFKQGTEVVVAIEYLLDTWIKMPDRTQGSIQSQLTLMLDPFVVEPYRALFSGQSTTTMAQVLDEGLVFYSFMPIEDRPEMAKLINTMLKLDYYRQVLLRLDKKRPSLFFCDEFQSFFTSDSGRGDGPFFSRSRQSFHANVVATQNYGGLLAEASRPEIVRNFLGNCAVKLFLRNTDGETNELASKEVFGEYSAVVVNLSESGSGRGGSGGFAQSGAMGEQLQRQRRVPPERFSGLAVPDREAGTDYAEAMLHLSTRRDVLSRRVRFKIHPLDN